MAEPVNDVTVNSYVCQLQRRHKQFQIEQRSEMEQIGSDFFGRFFHEYFLLRDKNSFDALLRSMLTPSERDRLQTDPTFTQAWQIFLDYCWLQKRVKQFGIIIGVILFCLAAVVLAAWALPHVIGPKGR
ncbi:MAG: hypothetical protein PCFJNLEI_03473 [Verrucomicrobiae bacterium]|nr:hypothetical protein [Verrucomicrobiae bacterium]